MLATRGAAFPTAARCHPRRDARKVFSRSFVFLPTFQRSTLLFLFYLLHFVPARPCLSLRKMQTKKAGYFRRCLFVMERFSGFIADRRDVFGGIHWHLSASFFLPVLSPGLDPSLRESASLIQWLQERVQWLWPKRKRRLGSPCSNASKSIFLLKSFRHL